MASTFLFLAMVSVLGFFYVIVSYIVKMGLLSFLPESTQESLVTVSIFDILVNIIIYRKLSKIIGAIVWPLI